MGSGLFRIAWIFSGSASTPSAEILWPSKVVVFTSNLHFSLLNFISSVQKDSRTLVVLAAS